MRTTSPLNMADFTVSTLKKPLTEEQALESELDVRPALRNLRKLEEFRDQYLHSRRAHIVDLCAEHLGISEADITLTPTSEWIRGTFNICATILINQTYRTRQLPRRVLIRFPLPFSVGEDFSPGSVDEKLRCEAATYVYLATECPSVPIPRLLGIGFPGKQSFSAVENASLWKRIVWQLRRGIAWLHGNTLSTYYGFKRKCLSNTGYLLLEYIEHGEVLTYTWLMHRHDIRRRANLYRGLARIMLDFAKKPQPRIGSWTMHDDGTISLTNRPLDDVTCFWNAFRIPTAIPRDLTYSSADSFVHDKLRLQDSRMRHQTNSILDKKDGIYQLSSLIGLRALVPWFWDNRSRHGPFVQTLCDMHQSNIFVDEDWNVTCLIDLEFAPIYPIQFLDVPHWFSARGVDQLEGNDLDEYKVLYDEFVSIVEKEEAVRDQNSSLSAGLRENWNTGRFWHNMALGSVNAFPAIFDQHLRPRFFKEYEREHDVGLMHLWDEDVDSFLEEKQKQLSQYEDEVRQIFATARACASEANPTAQENGRTDVSAKNVSIDSNCTSTA